jgi:hypothetical protein
MASTPDLRAGNCEVRVTAEFSGAKRWASKPDHLKSKDYQRESWLANIASKNIAASTFGILRKLVS